MENEIEVNRPMLSPLTGRRYQLTPAAKQKFLDLARVNGDKMNSRRFYEWTEEYLSKHGEEI